MFTIDGKYTKALITIDNIEPECLAQIVSMVNNEAFSNQVVIMPDTHSGKGSVIGFTMKMGDKIIPNIVGVDIGCGMLSYDIGEVDIDHKKFDDYIRRNVPFGMNVHADNAYPALYDNGSLGADILSLCKKIGMDANYALKSIGTLGGGNHFIEIGRSVNTGHIWITVHTGSRNLGKKVCEYWQKVATDRAYRGETKEDVIKRIKSTFPKSEWQKEIVNLKNNIKKHRSTGLEYLEGEDLKGYLKDMEICQRYAKMNRFEIMNIILGYFGLPVFKTIETVHNYINFSDNIIRKGAISSYKGMEMVVPLNMRDGILLCVGKSNSDWNFSAPHGAGRVLSRSKAKQVVNLDEFRETMKDVFSTSVGKGTLDEAPFAYKNSKMIEEAIGPTADIVDRIIPIHNMKDTDGERE